ncbi:MAG: NYN domain-containing protein [Actinomycetota bacterium]
MADGVTYLLVDGENLDGVLGGILNHKPEPRQRPRWQHLLDFVEDEWGNPVKGLFFLNASRGLPASFIQALIAIGYRPVPLSGRADEKVVDIAIQRMLDALRDRDDDVMLGSHDADFADHLARLDGLPERRIGLVGFTEFVSQALRDVDGLEVYDLEHDAEAFEVDLPRVRVIPIDRFDPLEFL